VTSLLDGNIEHVFYTSQTDAHLRELAYSNGVWHGNDLTAITHGPATYASGLTAFVDGTIKCVFYVSQDYHVREMYYYNGVWQGSDLAAITNGPSADWVSLTGFVAP
jgi:hypothetical protein